MSQDEINRFCAATSALYYTIVASHARRCGIAPELPELLCPTAATPCAHRFDQDILDEAEKFLLRLGMIAEPDSSD
ncbi:MAG: hypothetical protein AAGB48_12475 [Planctomycetota bacterium]